MLFTVLIVLAVTTPIVPASIPHGASSRVAPPGVAPEPCPASSGQADRLRALLASPPSLVATPLVVTTASAWPVPAGESPDAGLQQALQRVVDGQAACVTAGRLLDLMAFGTDTVAWICLNTYAERFGMSPAPFVNDAATRLLPLISPRGAQDRHRLGPADRRGACRDPAGCLVRADRSGRR